MMTMSAERENTGLEAARWLVALEEEPENVELRHAFEAWLAESEANAAVWADTSDIHDLMAQVPPVHKAHWEPQMITGDLGRERVPQRRPSMMRRIPAAAAGLALAACLALFVVQSVIPRFQADYLTESAETKTFALSDGTVVHLAPDSALAVDFSSGERRVRLQAGEAFFDVTPDVQRPFRVAAGDVMTTVLGTTFNVHLSPHGADVAVRHGRVGVDAALQASISARLLAGDWIGIQWDGAVRRGTRPPDEVGAWMQGQIIVRDRLLTDVVADLRRYFTGVILVTDSDFGDRRVSGVYNVGDPAAALSAIVDVHGGRVFKVSPWLLVVVGNL